MRQNCRVLAALLAVLLGLFAAVGSAAADQTYYTDLSNLVSNVSITGAEVTGNTWTVLPDTPYTMSVVFTETGSKQFDMDSPDPFTYQLPAGIVLPGEIQTGYGQISYRFGAEIYYLQYKYTVSPDGSVKIIPDYDRFAAEYGERILNALKQQTRLHLDIDFTGQFHRENEHLEWGTHVKTDVVVDLEEKHDLQIVKTAEYDPQNGFVNYTLRVTSEGNNQNIVVKDNITGNALKLDGTVTIPDPGSSTCTLVSETETSFEYAIDSMTDGQVIEFKYRAKVDYEADGDHDGQLTYDQTRNTATVTGDGTDEKQVNWGNQIQFSSVSKGNGQVVGGEGTKQTVSWTVEVNKERIISVADTDFTDSIVVSPGNLPMQYSGDGIDVWVYDINGAPVGEEPRHIPWSEVGVTDKSQDTSYTYHFPETDDGIYSYKIIYTTEVDVSGLTGDGTVQNDAGGKYGHGTGSAGITGHDEEGKPKISKNLIGHSIEEATWQVIVHVPEGGLPPQYGTLTDTFPGRYFYFIDPPGYLWDELLGDPVITGLQSGDSATVVPGTHQFEVHFKDGNGNDGLTGIGAAYDVYITFKTKNNPDWIRYASQTTDTSFLDHANTASLSAELTATAVETITSPTADKSVSDSILEQDGVRYLEYDIILGGVTSGDNPITIQDEFDTGVFRVPTDAEAGALWQQFYVLGGTQYSQITPVGTAVYSNIGGGINITVADLPSDLPYGYLKVHYWLALKDDVDLDRLAAEAGGKWTTTNKAIWNDVSAEATFEHDYLCLTKELSNLAEIDNDHRIAKYRITFNPLQGRVNGGEDIILRDTWSESLNIDYSSIRITTVPESANENVSYTISGYTATFTIPDQTKVVIEYSAVVLGTGPVEFSNDAAAGDWEDGTKETYTFSTHSTGTGVGVYFPVLKVDENNNRIRIPGVKFKLTAPKGFSLKKGENLYEVTLETDANGELLIDQSKYVLFFYDAADNFRQDDPKTYVVYTLTELEPPAGYAPLGFSYTISFTDNIDQVTFDKSYIYPASGGSLQIKNTPLEGLTVRKKTVGDDSGKQFLFTITLDDSTISGTYGKMDDQGRYDEHAITFKNGGATFLLKDGEYKQAVGLPAGIGYTITETLEDGTPAEDYSTVSSGRTADGGQMTPGGATFTGTTRIEGTEITYVNTKVTLTATAFQAIKVLTGRKMTGREFSFGVYDENGILIQTVQNDENGVVSFEPISYKLADVGIHTYTVKEIVPEGVTPENPTQGGYTYDLTSYTVKVQVVYYGDGILKAGVIDVYEN